MIVTILVCVAVFVAGSEAARILGVVPTPSYSHQVVFQPLWRELSLRGHRVTTITTDPINDPSLTNLTEISLHFSYIQWTENVTEKLLTYSNTLMLFIKFMDLTINLTEDQLNHPDVQALLNSDQEFDLLIVEPFVSSMFAFAVRFQCPTIAMLSIDGVSNIYQLMGNPTHPVVYPDAILNVNEMTFTERIKSVISTQLYALLAMYGYSQQDRLIAKYFGQNYPSSKDIMMNTSMLFVNSDPIIHRVSPLVPTVIQIGGGSHLQPPKPIPQDLQKLLDNAKDGFIYFSLGSNIKSKDIPMETRNTILGTFSELPYTVLWKFEADDLLNKPDNVFISKWLPQQDVLRHPNIKLFITQGGLQSCDEAIYSGVPIVGMPFYGDQGVNIQRLVSKGIGLGVSYDTLAKEDFKEKILEVVQNPKYQKKVVQLATLAQDQPMTGLDRAVWWTEYVIRHKGAKHLRSPLLDIPWYQYLLLDVLSVILLILSITLYLLYKLFYYLFRFIYSSRLKSYEKKIK